MRNLIRNGVSRVQMTLIGAQKNPAEPRQTADTVYQAATVAAALLLVISAAVMI